MRKDEKRQTDTTMLITAFPSFANVTKNYAIRRLLVLAVILHVPYAKERTVKRWTHVPCIASVIASFVKQLEHSV
jgi:hypothetical protein